MSIGSVVYDVVIIPVLSSILSPVTVKEAFDKGAFMLLIVIKRCVLYELNAVENAVDLETSLPTRRLCYLMTSYAHYNCFLYYLRQSKLTVN